MACSSPTALKRSIRANPYQTQRRRLRGGRRLPAVPLFGDGFSRGGNSSQSQQPRKRVNPSAVVAEPKIGEGGSLLELDEDQMLDWRRSVALKGLYRAPLLPFTSTGSSQLQVPARPGLSISVCLGSLPCLGGLASAPFWKGRSFLWFLPARRWRPSSWKEWIRFLFSNGWCGCLGLHAVRQCPDGQSRRVPARPAPGSPVAAIAVPPAPAFGS